MSKIRPELIDELLKDLFFPSPLHSPTDAQTLPYIPSLLLLSSLTPCPFLCKYISGQDTEAKKKYIFAR
ncbi:MAG: hypothetical protein JXB48_23175 [Candidatus Latescibacteria bacterium]|nr:hypothetical protein [Candidatus Latescibacterota bacterium]